MRKTMKHLASLSALAVASVISSAVLAQTTTPVAPPTTPPAASQASPAIADPFYSLQLTPANWRATELVGKPVYSRQDERIGEIDELILSNDGRIVAAVVGVGGFLGMGERKVAIAFPAMKMVRESSSVTKISVDLSKETLKAAPAYTMPKTN
jgi:sporulation protein YlmC with PRC-barrel domain